MSNLSRNFAFDIEQLHHPIEGDDYEPIQQLIGPGQSREALGLRNWDLFLNMGLAQLENGELDDATDGLRRAVLFGEDHSESDFNLALVYERRGMHGDAEREMLASLRLNPQHTDARNMLGVIYAEEGKASCASLPWHDILREAPDYDPARANLAILGSQRRLPAGADGVSISYCSFTSERNH